MRPRDRRKRAQRNILVGWLVVLAIGASTLIPNALVWFGTRRATACIKQFEAPRTAELPWCGDAMNWFSFPARVPWTVTPATYRAEELRVRIAMGHYQNAVAGTPNRAARATAAELVQQAATIVRTGSRRLAFEEIGPAVGAPDPGQEALLVGDRDLLLSRAKEWDGWHQRLHTLRAALLHGDLGYAVSIAKHYATYDPREEDLRTAVGVVLCLGDDGKRAMDMFVLQQNDRAARRYAAMSRNWGDVRTGLLACAAAKKITPPPRPASSEAGQDDHRIVRAPLRLRVVEDHDNRLREAQEASEQLLSGALPAGARAPVLASLLASGATFPIETWVNFATPHTEQEEPPLLDLGSVNVLSWMELPDDRPQAVGDVYRRGGEKLLEIAAKADAKQDSSEAASPSVQPSVPAQAKAQNAPHGMPPHGARVHADAIEKSANTVLLEAAAGALFIEGARAFVRAGDAPSALRMVERATPFVKMDPVTAALAGGLIRYATADIEGAQRVLAAAPSPAPSDPPELSAALLTLRAETSGNWGPPSKELADIAFAAAQKTQSAALKVWARRVRFWANPNAEPPSFAKVASLDVMAGRFSIWPSLGYANSSVQWGTGDEQRLALFRENIGVWSLARRASEEDKRAFRYAVLRHRGDMPDAVVPYLAVASELAGKDGEPEVWLDAVMATDAPRFSMRAYAWARLNVAYGRGDRQSHAVWLKRFEFLATLIGTEDTAELARIVGI